MAGSKIKRERKERWQKFINGDHSVDDFLDFLIEGGTIEGFAIKNDFKYLWIIDWVESDEKFYKRFLKIKEYRADIAIDELITIADTCSIEEVAKARLQIDARIKFSGKVAPDKYGDRINHSSDGTLVPHYTVIMVPEKEKLLSNNS